MVQAMDQGTQAKERWMDAKGTIEGTMDGSESNRRSDGSVSNQRSDGSERNNRSDGSGTNRRSDVDVTSGEIEGAMDQGAND